MLHYTSTHDFFQLYLAMLGNISSINEHSYQFDYNKFFQYNLTRRFKVNYRSLFTKSPVCVYYLFIDIV